MKSLPGGVGFPEADDAKEVAAAYPGADYVLDVQTVKWGTSHYKIPPTKYFVTIHTRTRLIDAKSGKVVAKSQEEYESKDKDQAPGYDGIFEKDAAFLKGEIQKSSDAASGGFEMQL